MKGPLLRMLNGTYRRPQRAPRVRQEPSFRLESIEDELK